MSSLPFQESPRGVVVNQERAEPELQMMPYDIARETCHATRYMSDLPATFNEDAAQAFAASIDVIEVKKFGGNLALDSNMTQVDATFTSVDSEAALIVVMHALDFGGGWRRALHSYHGKLR
jgi:hypothetical protein